MAVPRVTGHVAGLFSRLARTAERTVAEAAGEYVRIFSGYRDFQRLSPAPAHGRSATRVEIYRRANRPGLLPAGFSGGQADPRRNTTAFQNRNRADGHALTRASGAYPRCGTVRDLLDPRSLAEARDGTRDHRRTPAFR